MENSWKMKCVDNGGAISLFVTGKVYDVKNGTLSMEDEMFPIGKYESFEEWQSHCLRSKWELIAEEQKPDSINPSHYKNSCSLECIEAMRMAFGKEIVYDFCICNAWKYMWRYENKNGIEDINKAQWYVDKAKELIDCRSEYENIQAVLDKIKRRVK